VLRRGPSIFLEILTATISVTSRYDIINTVACEIRLEKIGKICAKIEVVVTSALKVRVVSSIAALANRVTCPVFIWLVINFNSNFSLEARLVM